jgi:hypothetical protein
MPAPLNRQEVCGTYTNHKRVIDLILNAPWLLVHTNPDIAVRRASHHTMAPHFISLGMVVVVELRFPDTPAMYDVPGGSGAFSTPGARLVAGNERSHEVRCVIMAGDDFPAPTLAQFVR